MNQEGINLISSDLDFAKQCVDHLIALFGYNDKTIIYRNKVRAVCAADCVISIMKNLKEVIGSDDQDESHTDVVLDEATLVLL